MDENEWNDSRDVDTMLAFVAEPNPPPGAVRPLAILTERQLRLFLVGCCRRQWALFEDPVACHAVEVAERFADGLASAAEREEAHRGARALYDEAQMGLIQGTWPEGRHRALMTMHTTGAAFIACWTYPELIRKHNRYRGLRIGLPPLEEPTDPAFRTLRADKCQQSLVKAVEEDVVSSEQELQSGTARSKLERAAQADLLRCVAGSPFREVRFEPAWRSDDVVGLARSIYEDRAFDRLPILSDALLDAGCNEDAVVTHCRDGRPHTRGCWVVDLILGMG